MIATEFRDVSQDITNGDDADGLTVFHDGQVPVTAAVHFPDGEGQWITRGNGFRIRRHEFSHGMAIPTGSTGDLRQKIALGQDADE